MGELVKKEDQLPATVADSKKQALRVVTQDEQAVLTSVLVNGDVGKLNDVQKWTFYNGLCTRLGLDPFTRPFKIIKAQGKEVLYADATLAEQLAALRDLTVEPIEEYIDQKGNMVIKVKVYNSPNGRFVIARGVLPYDHLGGEAAANAQMKCETKAFRRGVLKYCGLSEFQDSDDAPKDGISVEIGEPKQAPKASVPRRRTTEKKEEPQQAPPVAKEEPPTVDAEQTPVQQEEERGELDQETGEIVYDTEEEEPEESEPEQEEEQEEEPAPPATEVKRKRGWG